MRRSWAVTYSRRLLRLTRTVLSVLRLPPSSVVGGVVVVVAVVGVGMGEGCLVCRVGVAGRCYHSMGLVATLRVVGGTVVVVVVGSTVAVGVADWVEAAGRPVVRWSQQRPLRRLQRVVGAIYSRTTSLYPAPSLSSPSPRPRLASRSTCTSQPPPSPLLRSLLTALHPTPAPSHPPPRPSARLLSNLHSTHTRTSHSAIGTCTVR